MIAYPIWWLQAPSGLNVGLVRGTQHGHEHQGAADFARAAVGHADGLVGVVKKQARAGRVVTESTSSVACASDGIARSTRCAVAVRLFCLVLLSQQLPRHAFLTQFVLHVRRRPLYPL